MIFVGLFLSALLLFLSYKFQIRLLLLGSKVVAQGFKVLGKEEDDYVTCPNCSKKVKRTSEPYCSKCDLYF